MHHAELLTVCVVGVIGSVSVLNPINTMKVLLFFALVVVAWGKPTMFRNPMINKGLFEGDLKGIDPEKYRNAVPSDSQRWPNGVLPYEIDSSLNSLKPAILRAMKHISDNTCISFVQHTNQKDYVKMLKKDGCWSYWGFLGQGEQELSLGDGCEPFGTIVHEILHALGFEHEHNRSDRDDYLIIHWGNIDEDQFSNFDKLPLNGNRMLTPFDFDSIMLYGQYSFSKQWGVLKSMEAKDGRYMPEPYDKAGLSPSDTKRIQLLYKC